MLIDPDYLAELEDATPHTDKTLDFLKKVLRPIRYVEAVVAGSTLTCQVKYGDGENYEDEVDVMVRSNSMTGTITVSVGTQTSGALGVNAAGIKTTAEGQFEVVIGGVEPTLVELVPHQGVSMMVLLNF